MKYCVTFAIDARYTAEVDADSPEEAVQNARQEFSDADFGEAFDVDGEEIIVEDDAGNYVWEK